MGFPLVCNECGTRNGLLAEECRNCGKAISRSGAISRIRIPGQGVPSAAWETPPIPELWRRTDPLPAGPREIIDAHDLFRYALLLRAMGERFEQDDDADWFDDALFFLRGGYDFFCHLNTTSNMTMRGRIFGGLNHAQAPANALRRWLNLLVAEARERGVANLHVFVAEEINSGSGAHRIMNVIRDALPTVAAGRPLSIDFRFYLARTDESVLDVERFAGEVASKRIFDVNAIRVQNSFRLFQGPLLAYDEERFSGLRLESQGSDSEERYSCIRHRMSTIHVRCPQTQRDPYWCAPGENDLDSMVGGLTYQLLSGRASVTRSVFESRLEANGCEECRNLFGQLDERGGPWTDILL